MSEKPENNNPQKPMGQLLSTKEVAQFLNVHEKIVYALVSEKGLPATKVTGKWLFPQNLVEKWLENNTVNLPYDDFAMPLNSGVLIVAGSNDPLLDKMIMLYNRQNAERVAVFGNLGSLGGLKALHHNLCHIAGSHILDEDDSGEYNFSTAKHELSSNPVVMNFCKREQGLILPKGNPRNIYTTADLGQAGLRLINRLPGTGTRVLLDRELQKHDIAPQNVLGYADEVGSHLDVAIKVKTGQADVGMGIRVVAQMLDLNFVPLRWERYDFIIGRDNFFGRDIQHFLALLHEKPFKEVAASMQGYDMSLCGKMVFPHNADAV